MKLSHEIGGRRYNIDLADPIDISIPLDFHGRQPNAYGVDRASAEAVRTGGLVGDTRRGGSCNFERVTFVPHCNGTHTECVGHITNERISVRDCLKDAFVPATLVSVDAENAVGSSESYAVEFGREDTVISKSGLEAALSGVKNPVVTAPGSDKMARIATAPGAVLALILRTLPNDGGKLTREYGKVMPPYFSSEAMEFIVGLGVKHLLVDTPSIDRMYDEGRLSNHHVFWNVEPGKFETSPNTRIGATITELIYVPDEAADGTYLLNLQIAPFVSDAAPSRPLLFRLS